MLGRLVIRLERRVPSTTRFTSENSFQCSTRAVPHQFLFYHASSRWSAPGGNRTRDLLHGLTFGCFLPIIGLR